MRQVAKSRIRFGSDFEKKFRVWISQKTRSGLSFRVFVSGLSQNIIKWTATLMCVIEKLSCF